MCGIAGIAGGSEDRRRLEAMVDSMAHRGPDDRGQWWTETSGGAVGLSNLRLAIIDLSAAGHQPMERDGTVLAYNGEVYNFKALRSELEAGGTKFRGDSDTEVVLAVLRRDGAAGLKRLNGMFALAWWDSANEELLIARDRFGIKPLYWSHTPGGELVFASEYKALLAGGFKPQLNEAALPGYLSFGFVPGEATLLRNVHELAPGGILRWAKGEVSLESFRDALGRPVRGGTPESHAAELRTALSDAIGRQMVADVPVGVLLSGGLDSTTIAALAQQETGHTVRAYTIGFRDTDARLEQSADDAKFARDVADELGLDLKEIRVAPNIADELQRVVHHLDDPVADPAAILTLLISEAAIADGVKVLLSGQGADELFGGYRVHIYAKASRLVGHQPLGLTSAELKLSKSLARVAPKLPRALHPGLVMAGLRSADAVLGNLGKTPADRYIGFRSNYHFAAPAQAALMAPDLGVVVDPWATHRSLFAEHPEVGFFEQMLYVDLRTFLLNQNLTYGDRLSMAASVETRVPFLDDAVADLAFALPESTKLPRWRGKAVLREAVRGIVPESVITRRKAGFGAPIRTWLRTDLAGLMHDALCDEWLRSSGLFVPAEVNRLMREHEQGTADHTYRLWTLLSFALWHRQVFGGA